MRRTSKGAIPDQWRIKPATPAPTNATSALGDPSGLMNQERTTGVVLSVVFASRGTCHLRLDNGVITCGCIGLFRLQGWAPNGDAAK